MRRSFLLGSLSLAVVAAVAVACGTEGTLPDGGSAAGTRSTGKNAKGGSTSNAGNDGGGGDETGAGGDEGDAGSPGKGGSDPGKGGGTSTGGKGGGSTLSCETGKGDCNVDKSDGCETDLTSSLTNCGACGKVCEATEGQDVACKDGKCETACVGFTGDCDGNPANGCETDVSADLAHCGSCSAAPCKDGPHGAAACDGGKCGLACEKGWGDCDGDSANGCELNLTADPNNCGTCGTSCEGKPCTNSVCECAASATTAETLPLDIFLMLDKSSSMDTAVDGGGSATKWTLVIQALNGFINGVTAADQMGMGFGLFPSNSCDISAFNKATVPVGDLPGNAKALTDKLTSTKPNGGDTPTKPALEGAIDFAKKRLAQFPQRKIAVVLATDGEPNECINGFPTFPPKDVVSEVTAVAKAGFDAGVPTYAIGVFANASSGSAKANIEKWAKAGGTQKGFIVSADPQLAENLKKSLDEIRKTAIGCEYKVPQPAGGKALDPQKVNVVHTPSGGGAPNTLVYVPDAASCKANAWYYDNPTKPAKILLCPQACEVIKPDQAGKVEISVGCATRIDN